MLAKFHGNILNMSENMAKSCRGLLFWNHTVQNTLKYCKQLRTARIVWSQQKVIFVPTILTVCDYSLVPVVHERPKKIGTYMEKAEAAVRDRLEWRRRGPNASTLTPRRSRSQVPHVIEIRWGMWATNENPELLPMCRKWLKGANAAVTRYEV